MAATRLLSEFTYRSGSGSNAYQFTVSVDQQELISVRNIQSPTGLIIESTTSLPQSVITDINTAIGQVEDVLALTSPVNGTLTFVAETEKEVTFDTAMANTSYRVQLSLDSFVPFRITNKTVTGFTVQAGVTFTGNVGYDVFV